MTTDRDGMAEADGWVNAVIELSIPLDDVTVNSTKWEKQEAVGRVIERITEALPEGLQWVGSGHAEDVTDAR